MPNFIRRKALTIEDLVKFCEERKVYSFDSKEQGYRLSVQVPATFEIDENVDDAHRGMLKLKFRIFHTGKNRNGSFVSEEAAKDAMPTIKNRPILAAIHQLDNGEWDFEAHNFEIVKDEVTGKEETVYIEKQVGSFDESEPFFEYDEKLDKTFICSYGYISEDYSKAAEIIRLKNGTKNSCELSIDEMSFDAKNRCLSLDKFYVAASTLLGRRSDGTEIGEGMEGSRADIADFSQEKNSIVNNFIEELNTKLIETLEKLNTTLSNFNINHAEESANETYEEGGNTKVNNEKFLELLEKYNKTEDDIDFEVEGLSDEELEAKFEEVFGDESEEEPTSTEGDDDEGAGITDTNACGTKKKKKKCEEEPKEGEETPDEPEEPEEPVVNEDNDDDDENLKENNACGTKKKKKKCSRTYEFELSHDDIRYALYNLLAPYEESDNDYYWIVAVYDDYFVYQGYSGNYFGQKYSVEEDNVAFDGERYELYVEFLTKSEKTELEDMRSNYSSISDQLAKYQEAETKAQKEEILTDKAYSRFMEEDAFKAIVEEADSLSVEELRTKCELTFAKLVKEHGNFAMVEEPETKRKNKIGINTNFEASSDSEPYGDYFKSLEV